MNRIYTTPKLVVFALILSFVVTDSGAVEGLSGLSGKVIDLEGNAVPGFTLAIQPRSTARRFSGTRAR